MKTPYKYLPVVSELYRYTRKLFNRLKYKGDAVECPICLNTFSSWLNGEENGTCPYCRSETRSRLLWLFLEKESSISDKKFRILHFAPEDCLKNRFSHLPHIEYVTADLCAPNVDVKTDLQNLVFEENSFDMIVCSHVLEHIPNDRTAMAELYRVLVSQGIAYIQVPYASDRKTDEDPNIVDPKEREKRFGQFDHVRKYGTDLKSRLENVGFEVETKYYARNFDSEECVKYGLWDDVIFQCKKL